MKGVFAAIDLAVVAATFFVWMTVGHLPAGAQTVTINPPVPTPIPMGMGGTGGTVGAQLQSSTISGLPTCNASNKGQLWFVTDALLPSLGVIIAAGGSVHVLVFCDGANWIGG